MNNNSQTKKYPEKKSIHGLFEQQANITPENTALIFEETAINYKNLNSMANNLAAELKKINIKNSIPVAFMLPRSIDMIIAILGILKAGGSYLPIDPALPNDRIKYMLEDSNAELLLCSKKLDDKLSKINFDKKILYLDKKITPEGNINNFNNTCSENALAYVIYTSGTTGKPKGVMIEHKNVLNFITGVSDIIDFSAGKTILNATTVSFDIFVLETILALAKGLKIIIANEKAQKDPYLLKDLIIKNNIEMLQFTPSSLNLFRYTDFKFSFLNNVKELMVGGEVFPQKLFDEIKSSYKGKIYNMYGPTETTVWSTIKNLTNETDITIGPPIFNTELYVLDSSNNFLPAGEKGELCIGGDGLGRGYLNNNNLTKEKFIYIKQNSNKPLKIYKTGDIAMMMPDGEIKLFGRSDEQVKIKGFRIELKEIEHVLETHKDIKQAVVSVQKKSEDEKILYAYIVSDIELKYPKIKDFLLKKLPEYMIPKIFKKIDRIPLSNNGKIDRKNLNILCNQNINLSFSSGDALTTKIKTIWQEILNISDIKMEDNFFDLGGSSLGIVKLKSLLKEKLNEDIQIADLFEHTTVNSLSNHISKKSKALEEDNFKKNEIEDLTDIMTNTFSILSDENYK